jgi:hypothetical protein
MSSVLVNPTSSSATTAFALAPRSNRDLKGKTVGLLDNTKYNSDRLLEEIGVLLGQRYQVAGVVQERKPYFGRPVPDDQAKALAERCDVVVTAVGD